MKMNQKPNKLVAVLLLSLLFIVGGCAKNDAPAAPKAASLPKEINVTYVKAPLNVPSIVEKQTNAFEKEFTKDNIAIKYPQITAGPKQTEAMAAGAIDFAHALGGTSAILAASNGVNLKIVGIYSRAPKAFVMLVKDPTIKTPADLKGKKIAGPKGTVLHQLALTALGKNGLKATDVQYLSMDISSAVAALMNGSVDVAMAAGPDAMKAQQAGARLLTTGEGLVEATIVTAVRGEFLDKHPDLVKRFMKTHIDTVAAIKANNVEALAATAKETGLPIEVVKQMFPWYDFDATVKPTDIEELKRTQEFLLKNGMLSKPVAIESLIVKVQ